jgi:UrcA family protein
VRSETVKFQDLNVGTPAGVEALYGRIHSAAVRVCSPSGGRLPKPRLLKRCSCRCSRPSTR